MLAFVLDVLCPRALNWKQAQMPVTVFLTGLLLGTERYSFRYAANLVVVAIGVGTASYGESMRPAAWRGGRGWVAACPAGGNGAC